MSAYLVNKVCYEVQRDETFREQVRGDPDGTFKGMGLAPEEVQAFKAGDIAGLYRLGGHPFLMQHLWRAKLFGLTRELHFERIVKVLEV